MSWNDRDKEPPINGTQYFTRLCMLRISTPDLTFRHCTHVMQGVNDKLVLQGPISSVPWL